MNKNKIFFTVFFTLIAVVIIITFAKYFIAKDYYIEAEADCDPYTKKCFIWECDPNSDVDGEKCTGDAEKDIWYFQKVRKIANEIPTCDPNDENCDALACESGMDCEVTYCDENSKEAEQSCNDPVKYTEENPLPEEEEVEECAPDDEECVNSTDEDNGDKSVDENAPSEEDAGEESGMNIENFIS